MSLDSDLLAAFETHSCEGIAQCLAVGASPVAKIKGLTPIESLVASYFRSERFAACLRILLDAGATIDDPVLQAVLLDDDACLLHLVTIEGPSVFERRFDFVSAFTNCRGVTPLHVCAEFNSVRCGRVLLQAGADVNATAGVDAAGHGGQTPVFHAVNTLFNYCRPMMVQLVDFGARLDVTLKGLTWGVDMPWETLLLDVTPLSFAQAGLLPQFHRPEHAVYDNLAYLYEQRYGIPLVVRNVPNVYLQSHSGA